MHATLHWDPSYDADRYFADDEPPAQPRCDCGAFLSAQPTAEQPWEAYDEWESFYNAETRLWDFRKLAEPLMIDAGTMFLRTCMRCGHTTKWDY